VQRELTLRLDFSPGPTQRSLGLTLFLSRAPHRGTERSNMESKEHDGARQRLHAAVLEQDRLGEQLDAAVGTSTELEADVRHRAAGKQVAAREAWVHWVDDENYPGAQRGPVRTAPPGAGS